MNNSNNNSLFKYVVVLLVAVIAFYGIHTLGSAGKNSGQPAPYNVQQTTGNNTTQPVPENVPQSVTSENTAASDNAAKTVYLSDLQTVGENSFRKLFRMESDVEDYYHNQYSTAYVLAGDGMGYTYRNKVTFLNPDHYQWIKGEIILSGDDASVAGMEYGYMCLVMLDGKGNEIASTKRICADNNVYKAAVNFYIGDMDEFTLAVDATDGRAGGYDMHLIANAFELE